MVLLSILILGFSQNHSLWSAALAPMAGIPHRYKTPNGFWDLCYSMPRLNHRTGRGWNPPPAHDLERRSVIKSMQLMPVWSFRINTCRFDNCQGKIPGISNLWCCKWIANSCHLDLTKQMGWAWWWWRVSEEQAVLSKLHKPILLL